MSNKNNQNLISSILGLSFIFALSLLASLPTKASAILYYDDWMDGTYSGYNSSSYNIDDDYNYYNYNNGNNWNNNGNNNNVNPIPSVFSVSPNSIKILSNTTITVSGNDFVRGSTIRLNDSNIPTTFVNSQTLKGQINVNSKGNYFISVFSPAPGGGFSNAISLSAISNVVSSTNTNTTASTTSVTNKTKTSTKNNINNEATDESGVKDLAAGAIFGYNGFLPSSIFQWIFFAILILLAIILWRKLYVSDEEKHAPLKHA